MLGLGYRCTAVPVGCSCAVLVACQWGAMGDWGVMDVVALLLGLAGLIILLVAFSKRKQWRDEAAAQMPEWEKAIQMWNQLYYCARCDGVFIPGVPGTFNELP